MARHFISRQQADSARFALDKAQAQLKAASRTLRLAELGPRKEDIAAAQATLAANEAAVAVIQRDIREGELDAPSDGIIENRILEPGDMASPQKPVFTLALIDPVWVRTYLSETQLGRVPVGARAWVHTDSHPEKRYRAWVGYVSPSAEFTPKSVETTEIRSSLVYQARVFVCEGQNELRHGHARDRDHPPGSAGAGPGGGPLQGRRMKREPGGWMRRPVLVAADLAKSFTAGERKVQALDGVSFAIRPGAVTGLIGPDGAGKTTLMRLAAGLLVPDAGTIQVLGLDATRESLAVQADAGLHAAALRPVRGPLACRRTSTSTPTSRACRRTRAPSAMPN